MERNVSNSIISLLSKEEKKQLFSESKVKTYSTGHILFNQGDYAKCMYLVTKGKVTLFRLMPDGTEKLFKVFMSGDLIAEVAMFLTTKEYPMTAKIEQETELNIFHHEAIINIIMQSPELSIKIISYMGNKINHLMNTLNILTQVNANQRFIMKLAEIYNAQSLCEGKVYLTVTKKLLATQLGMTPETLSRVINKLKTNNLLEESGNSLTLPSIPLLCQSVNLPLNLFK